MPRPPRHISAHALAGRDRDILQVQNVRKNTRAKPIGSHTTDPDWPPVPDLFDVITYFRARGDSFTLISSIGFWVGENSEESAHGAWPEAVVRRRARTQSRCEGQHTLTEGRVHSPGSRVRLEKR